MSSYPLLQADCKRAVASLNNLTNNELDEIMNNDEKLENILISLDQSYLKEIEMEKETILANNTQLAEENLNREPELVEGREKLQQLTEEGEQLSRIVEQKTKELREKTGDMSLETALALLQTAASEMEEESDKIAKRFLENESDFDDFLDQFLIKRKLMHLRLVKAEKLTKILSRDPTLSGGGGGGSGNYMNTPPMNLNTNYFPGVNLPTTTTIANPTVPYPIGPLVMPMPPPPTSNYFQNHY